ncbi:thiosulfate sulfurtransferase [Naematelia encephala]|uniref:Thiosulfate sulfurtransferase n=1 Tax=Naematelia encephala TaxID=71784 RepID=A0A1Y2B657_9TREE|nr:thiosulfate sulfurtransferase [Naematelia encephala]
MSPFLVNPSSPLLHDPLTVLLDGTWLYRPAPGTPTPLESYRTRRLPKARFWDYDAVAGSNPLGLSHMLPDPEQFAQYVSELGISGDSKVIIYDGVGSMSSCRVAWIFTIYGHENVSILDGGLGRAVDEGLALEFGEPSVWTTTNYPVPTLRQQYLSSYEDVLAYSQLPSTPAKTFLIDARNAESFSTSPGHIPNSLNLPWRTFLATHSASNEVTKQWIGKSWSRLPQGEDLVSKLEGGLGSQAAEAVLQDNAVVINTCGAGISACILWAALRSRDIDSKVYEESWEGWSKRHPLR